MAQDNSNNSKQLNQVVKGQIVNDDLQEKNNSYLSALYQLPSYLVSPFYTSQNTLGNTISGVVKLNFALPAPGVDSFWLNFNTSNSRFTPLDTHSLYDAGFYIMAENNVLNTLTISIRSNISVANASILIYKIANGGSLDDQSQIGNPIGSSENNGIQANKSYTINFTPLIINKYDVLFVKLSGFGNANFMGNISIF